MFCYDDRYTKEWEQFDDAGTIEYEGKEYEYEISCGDHGCCREEGRIGCEVIVYAEDDEIAEKLEDELCKSIVKEL